MIEKFEIIGLLGDRNISIDFQKDENIKILVGENGTGKTHILNILYYILSGKINKLVDIEFERIILKIKDNNEIIVNQKDILLLYRANGDYHCKLKKYLSSTDYYIMQNMIKRDYSSHEILNTSLGRKLKRRLSSDRFIDMIEESIFKYRNRRRGINLFDIDEDLYERTEEKIRIIKENISNVLNLNTFIYLPTYRRVEADLEKLGLTNIKDNFERSVEDTFIQFGMDDTEKHIKKLLESINKLSGQGLYEISGDFINSFMDSNSIDIDETDTKIIQNIETLNIMLDRSNKVSEETKSLIIQKVENKEIFNRENKPLLLFLINLIQIYNKQKGKDERIKKFRDICNKYLVDKNFIYNENSVNLSIKNELTKNPLELETLSSGEKQLVSIFARIYLACEEDFILFIDEPEISMSMEWQKMILSDILDSGKCKLLFATTHSPFIFDDEENKLESHTVDIVMESTTPYHKV